MVRPNNGKGDKRMIANRFYEPTGVPVAKHRRSRRPAKDADVKFRCDRRLKKRVERAAEKRGIGSSGYVRMAILLALEVDERPRERDGQ
jgi:hypothetical protein